MPHLTRTKLFFIGCVLLFIVALISRFVYLEYFPPLLLQDEAGIGYSAISIAQTGKDEWGTSWPLMFRSFGEYKAGVYIYLTAAVYAVMGWSPILPRIISALAGSILVSVTMYWLYLLTGSKRLAWIAGVITLISPWMFHLSRTALESNLALLFFAVGLCFFELSRKKPARLRVVLTALFFAASAYTYQAYKLIIPVFLIGYVAFFDFKKINFAFFKTTSMQIGMLTAILFIPLLFAAGGTVRLKQVVSAQPELVTAIQGLQQNTCHLLLSQLGGLALNSGCQALWNQKTIVVSIVWQHILEHINPSFLFFTGDSSLNRNPTQTGAFTFLLFPFFVVGVVSAWKSKKMPRYILGGFLVAMTASIIAGTPHAIRLTALFPFVTALIVFGIDQFHSKYLTPALTVILLVFFTHFAAQYAVASFANSQDFLSYSKKVAQTAYRYWQDGYTVHLDRKVMPEPHIFVGFWNNMDALTFQKLVSNYAGDAQQFSRPEKIGDTLILDEPNLQALICNTPETEKVLLITNDKLPFIGTDTMYAATGVHLFATAYDVTTLRAQKSTFASYCK